VAQELGKARTVAGIALGVGALSALLLAVASRGVAAAIGLHGPRPSSLTVTVPPAANDRIYGSPMARGRPIVVIDAGHGGRDPGATSVSGEVVEKTLSLELARELRDQLVKRGRVRVAMTRDDDRYLTLEDRAAVARRLDAAMFVSLHVDSAPNPLARGATVYSLSDVASDSESARLAAAENRGASTGSGDGLVGSILSDLAMRTQMRASADLAVQMVGASSGWVGLRPNPHRFADFHVLRRAGAPAVLFEAGYISNADDELLLRSPRHRADIVLALAKAVESEVALRARR
jgi:N-acetylmuramoyl-L-alanine amidase